MPRYQLAQLNIATARAPMESPVMADFVANLDRINALADASPGFVWRLQTEEGDATALRPFGDDTLVNMSVWADPQALRDFVFSSDHVAIMRRRGEWFERMADVYMALWWVPAGHRPTVEEAKERLDCLRCHGPTERAFNFRTLFPAPDDADRQSTAGFGDRCPAV